MLTGTSHPGARGAVLLHRAQGRRPGLRRGAAPGKGAMLQATVSQPRALVAVQAPVAAPARHCCRPGVCDWASATSATHRMGNPAPSRATVTHATVTKDPSKSPMPKRNGLNQKCGDEQPILSVQVLKLN